MRMWMINPSCMCQQHLLGEHVELHMTLGCLEKQRWKVIRGLVDKGCLELASLHARHDQLVMEMGLRGLSHKSPLAPNPSLVIGWGKIDRLYSSLQLLLRCADCRDQANRALSMAARTEVFIFKENNKIFCDGISGSAFESLILGRFRELPWGFLYGNGSLSSRPRKQVAIKPPKFPEIFEELEG